jgi:hypothetical protein
MKQDLHPWPPVDVAAPPSNSWLAPRKLLAAGASYWNISRGKMLALWLLPLAILVGGVAARIAGKPVYAWLTEEDGFCENMQVLCYLAGIALAALVIRCELRRGQRLMAALYVVVVLGLVFMVGEETSWGQRIFGWATPEEIAAINKQKETNLHNIKGVGASFKWVQLLVGAVGTIAPLVVLGWKRLAPWREQLYKVLPHFTLIPFFLPMFAWRCYRNFEAFAPPKRFYHAIEEYNEVVELVLALGVVCFLVLRLRRHRQPTELPAAESSYAPIREPLAAGR